jgi:hypothetical protein
MRPPLTPCLICEKAVVYLWSKDQSERSTNLNNASDVKITAWYGSSFDMNEYKAVICDDCLDEAIQKRRVAFVKEHSPFGE